MHHTCKINQGYMRDKCITAVVRGYISDAAEAARLARKRRTPFTSGTAWLRLRLRVNE